MSTIKNVLLELMNSAKVLGLEEQDLKVAKDFLDHQELGLCFDTIITQMYEYGIEIDSEFYNLIDTVGKKMSIPSNSYSFMKELIRINGKVPTRLKEELARIISSLK